MYPVLFIMIFSSISFLLIQVLYVRTVNERFRHFWSNVSFSAPYLNTDDEVEIAQKRQQWQIFFSDMEDKKASAAVEKKQRVEKENNRRDYVNYPGMDEA